MAIGGHRGVLLNEAKLAPRSWIDRVALFAHELTHSCSTSSAEGAGALRTSG